MPDDPASNGDDKTLASAPIIDGLEPSGPKAGLKTDAALEPTVGLTDAAVESTATKTSAALDPTIGPESGDDDDAHDSSTSLDGYQLAELIGRGGMGEVVRGHDIEIGRDVAIKRLRGAQASPDAIGRFLREAKIQARLEHPAIIPVHSIGRDAEGQPYFTMKRITGVTLFELLERPDKPTRDKILRAIVDVCRCVDLAHSKRVVHRDLKPGNIMLGDYGEVYVLDWGLARVLDDDDVDGEGRKTMAFGVPSVDGETQTGAMLGTPGYMPAEQMEDARSVSTPADIYALGSILFEVLSGEPTHRKGEVLTSTMTGTDISPAKRCPDRDIPLELDALVVSALSREPQKRPTARELADRIEGFLDGDRDLEARRRIAALEVEDAREALESGHPGRRAAAMQAAGRALALVPSSRAAADLITSLMLEPPKDHPAALRAQLRATEIDAQKRQGRVALGSFTAVLAFLALCALNGINDWRVLGGITAFTLGLAALAHDVSRKPKTNFQILIVTLGNATLAALLSRMFGSLIIAPAVTCIMALSLTSYPQNIDRGWLVMSILALSWIAPVALEWAGLLPPTWHVTHGAVISESSIVEISGRATAALLVFANVMTILVFGVFANKLARARRDVQRQVEIQAWHLRQLLPSQ